MCPQESSSPRKHLPWATPSIYKAVKMRKPDCLIFKTCLLLTHHTFIDKITVKDVWGWLKYYDSTTSLSVSNLGFLCHQHCERKFGTESLDIWIRPVIVWLTGIESQVVLMNRSLSGGWSYATVMLQWLTTAGTVGEKVQGRLTKVEKLKVIGIEVSHLRAKVTKLTNCFLCYMYLINECTTSTNTTSCKG